MNIKKVNYHSGMAQLSQLPKNGNGKILFLPHVSESQITYLTFFQLSWWFALWWFALWWFALWWFALW